jgi:hypothetical protein
MRLHVNIKVPMGCPAEGCDGMEFYIVRSHPFGSDSKVMSVRCEKCEKHFYTDKGLVAEPCRNLASQLIECAAKVEGV